MYTQVSTMKTYAQTEPYRPPISSDESSSEPPPFVAEILKQPSIEQLNAMRSIGKYSEDQIRYFQDLYSKKVESRGFIRDIQDRQRQFVKTKGGIDVWFPFNDIYPCQEAYIQKTIETLQGQDGSKHPLSHLFGGTVIEEREGFDALLESPTGTGKTICLLSACVAYMKHSREKQALDKIDPDSIVPPELAGINPKHQKPLITLIYCTRTHSQIQQVLHEIREVLPYEVNAQVLASKTQLCINTSLTGATSQLDSNTLNHACKALRNSKRSNDTNVEEVKVGDDRQELQNIIRGLKLNTTKEIHSACKYYYGEEVRFPITQEESLTCNKNKKFISQSESKQFQQAYSERRFNPVIDRKVEEISSSIGPSKHLLDVEDLCKTGKEHQICPYYYARSKLPQSDIIIAPYSYILDPELRKTLQVDLKNSIIVFDEAHNIDSQCEEIMSFEMPLQDVCLAIKYIELVKIQAKHQYDQNSNYQSHQLIVNMGKLQEFLLAWIEALENYTIKNKKNISYERRRESQVKLFRLSFDEFVREVFDQLLLLSGDPHEIQYDNDDNEGDEKSQRYHHNQYANEFGPSNYLTGNIAQQALYNELLSVNPFKDTLKQQAQPGRRSNPIGIKQIKRQDMQVVEASLGEILSFGYECMRVDLIMSQSNIKDKFCSRQHPEDKWLTKTLPFSQVALNGKKKLSKLLECLQKMKKIRYLSSRSAKEDFIGFVKVEQHKKCFQFLSFGLMCLNPSYIFKRLIEEEKPRSVILTSGTLSPLSFVSAELKTKFQVNLVNQHIIDQQRVLVKIIDRGLNGKPLKFKFQPNRRDDDYISVGQLIDQLAPSIDGGILVYFTSYKILTDCFQAWCSNSITFKGIKIFKEDKDNTKLLSNFSAYESHIQSHGKAIFLCSCRGKMSEGLNFTDNLARACFIIGIPYLLVKNSRVLLKRQYLDNNCLPSHGDLYDTPSYHSQMIQGSGAGHRTLIKSDQNINGDEWYKITAIREVNQIIGRCIRHKNDYSTIFLVDERFKNHYHTRLLPSWVPKPVQIINSMKDTVTELKQFFKINSELFFNEPIVQVKSKIPSEINYIDLDEQSSEDLVPMEQSHTSSSSMTSYDMGNYNHPGCDDEDPSVEFYEPSQNQNKETIIDLCSNNKLNEGNEEDESLTINASQIERALEESQPSSEVLSICSQELAQYLNSQSQSNIKPHEEQLPIIESNLAKRRQKERDDEYDFLDPDMLLSQYHSEGNKRVKEDGNDSSW